MTYKNEYINNKSEYLNRFTIKTNSHVVIINVNDAYWFEAWGNYVRLHTHSGSYVIREKIGVLETKLDPTKFIRIHRSTIVQIGKVSWVKGLFHGDYLMILCDNTQLTLTRSYREHVLSVLLKSCYSKTPDVRPLFR